MIVLCLVMLAIYVTVQSHGHKPKYDFSDDSQEYTTQTLRAKEEFDDLAFFGDAQHRGQKWYDFSTTASAESIGDSSVETSGMSTSNSLETSSSAGSSAETKERNAAKKAYRACKPCPWDMLKSYKNVGIKWICGSYQRARRTFKSECMMRYRNCQDGTLFVKIYDHRCNNDTYHGRHWFYIYKADRH